MYSPLLPPNSFTSQRLDHATPEHLHVTTRRTFVGPIPDGWLKSHRMSWYRKYALGDRRRAPSFTAVNRSRTEESRAAVRAGDVGSVGPADSNEQHPRSSSLSATASALAASTASLIQHQRPSVEERGRDTTPVQSHSQNVLERSTIHGNDALEHGRIRDKLSAATVRFSEPTRLELRARAQRLIAKGDLRSSRSHEGEVLKMDRMLVRIDMTRQNVGADFDEKVSLGVETKSRDKWREYIVVCRKHAEDDASAVLQLYKTRVIAATISDLKKTRSRPKATILLRPKRVHINLYSSLDKTLCLWTGEDSRTTIYFLRPRSGTTSVEWFTFLRSALGWKRPQTLRVNIPDLSVTLRLDDPFNASKVSKNLALAAEGDDDALVKAVNDEKGAAGAIVTRCLDMLEDLPECADVLKAWSRHGRIGLAWKRYDRIEWVHGAFEQRMYGTIAMQRTHDLELRPKHHYPVTSKTKKGKSIDEPAPIEGFMIRLTSQRGQEQRMRRLLFKRLYFTTQNQYLLFIRPAKAIPPIPTKVKRNEGIAIPTTAEIFDQTSSVSSVTPYPLQGDHISWLDPQSPISSQEREKFDEAALIESERNMRNIIGCDGFINLCDVKSVRKLHKGTITEDQSLTDGSDVDFDFDEDDIDPSADTHDGSTSEIDEDRIFELVMRNGLVVRLQAFNKASKKEWMRRLQALKKYWTYRIHGDMELLKSVRTQNLKTLQIDERAEAAVGSFAYKWEVGQSYASPILYNMCGIAQCRAIHLAGPLFRKPRKHTTFSRCHVILAQGHLIIFQDTLRARSGRELDHVFHERIAAVDLDGCYLYSGLLTETDLLYQNRTFDSNTPGNHALPRVYLGDSWTSTDEDAMTTFVIWHAKSKSWFRSSHTVDDVRQQEQTEARDSKKGRKTKLTRVSQLGATGRSVVFKARSRTERDQWVMAIQAEIERVAAESQNANFDDVRIV